MNRRLTLYVLGLSALLLSTRPAAAQEADIDERPTITVQGEGHTSVAPDTVMITIGVDSRAAEAREALTANSDAMQRLMETLETQGVPKKNVQTVTFNVSPVYEDPNRPRRDPNEPPSQPKIVGYQVSNQVRIKLNKIGQLGDLLDVVVQNGANNIYGIQFEAENSEAAMDKARESAIADASRKAELLARAANARVGRPLRITENGTGQPPMPMRRMAMMAESSVPIAEGQQELSANVTVVYALEEKE